MPIKQNHISLKRSNPSVDSEYECIGNPAIKKRKISCDNTSCNPICNVNDDGLCVCLYINMIQFMYVITFSIVCLDMCESDDDDVLLANDKQTDIGPIDNYITLMTHILHDIINGTFEYDQIMNFSEIYDRNILHKILQTDPNVLIKYLS
eukprot:351442_1